MHALLLVIGLSGLLLSGCPAGASDAPATILAEAGGQRLTSQNTGEMLALYEWLLETPLTAEEKTRLTAILIDEFKANPGKAAANYVATEGKLAQIEKSDPLQRFRSRAEIWKAVAQSRPADPALTAAFKALADNPSLLLVSANGVVTQPQIDALVASDDLVADLAGLPKTSASARAELTRQIVAKFPGFDEKEDRYEALTDAEERGLSLRLWMESSPKNREAVLALIKSEVHGEADVPRVARSLENTALMLTRMSRYVLQQKILTSVAAAYEAQLEAIRAAGQHYSNHESRSYQHGNPTPGPTTGLGPQ